MPPNHACSSALQALALLTFLLLIYNMLSAIGMMRIQRIRLVSCQMN